jgi:hypothetical protein
MPKNAADRRSHKGWPVLRNDYWRQADRRQGYPNLPVGYRRQEEPFERECRTLGVEGCGWLRKVDGFAGMATSGLRLCSEQRNGL